jgi:hypothetical protein
MLEYRPFAAGNRTVRTDGRALESFSSPQDHRTGAAPESFALSHADHVIESLVLSDNRSVREYLGQGPSAREIAALAGEGIRRERFRCLEQAGEREEG